MSKWIGDYRTARAALGALRTAVEACDTLTTTIEASVGSTRYVACPAPAADRSWVLMEPRRAVVYRINAAGGDGPARRLFPRHDRR